MKAVICTSNGIRHKFFANSIIENIDDGLIISEVNSNDSSLNKEEDESIIEHFNIRHKTELEKFSGNDFFRGKILPVLYKELNLEYVYDIIKQFSPDVLIVFGSSIIREPLLSLLPNRMINLHLGLSPYYRGSGTNFWPFINNDLGYVGSTILHLDAGIDTGKIIAHVRPKIEKNDNVHTIGCKVIEDSIPVVLKIIEKMKKGEKINYVEQWKIKNEKYYKNKDFTHQILEEYKKNLTDGIIEKYLRNPIFPKKLVTLN